MAGKVGWLARGSRPDLLFPQVEMSTKFVKGKVRDLLVAHKAMRRIQANQSAFQIKSLGAFSEWSVEVSTDASLGNLNEGVNSTGAILVILANNKGTCVPILWKTNKLRRIVDSTLEAECIALGEGLKEAIYIREIIEEICNLGFKSVPLRAIVDNKNMVDAIHSTAPVEDKRLRRDVSKIKEMLNTGEVSSVSWCPGKDQLADCMTKRTAPYYTLLSLMQTGTRP